MKLIDSHHHFWKIGGGINYPWLESERNQNFFLGEYDSICHSFLSEDLVNLVPSGYELVGTIHCEAECDRNQSLEEIKWIDSLCMSKGLPSAQIAWVNLLLVDVKEHLLKAKQFSSVKGVRYKPVTANCPTSINSLDINGSLHDNKLHDGLQTLADLDLIWDLRVPSWHLLEAAVVLEDFPTLEIVVNHCGLPWDRSTEGLYAWEKGLEKLANRGNTWIKLSELGCPNQKYDKTMNQVLLERVLSIFGGKRAMFASNSPVSGIQVSYGDWLNAVELAIQRCVPTHRESVLWMNAVDCFGLDLKEVKNDN